MPDVEYVREHLTGGTPTTLGDTGLDGSGNLLVHNGTVAATVYSTANPPPGGAGSTPTFASLEKWSNV